MRGLGSKIGARRRCGGGEGHLATGTGKEMGHGAAACLERSTDGLSKGAGERGLGQAFYALVSADFWRRNPELLLAAVTLAALLSGWLGGSVSGALPWWAVRLAAVIAFAAGGYSGGRRALADARRGRLNIDFLMIVAALGTVFIGEWVEGALLLFLFTLSGALEAFAAGRSRQAIRGLAELRPDTAWVQRAGAVVEVNVDGLVVGEVVVVKPGERLPVDGTVVGGQSSVDQSAITGESVAVYKEVGDGVFAGTINGSGALEVEASKLASESTLSRIIGLVQAAQENAAPTQRFIDRFSQPYTLVVIGATVLAIVIPWLFADEAFDSTFYRAMTLLVVASPCALIISTPAAILSAIAAAAREGVLFKGGAYLEKAAGLEALAFDKTGTLTYGKPRLTDVVPLNNFREEDVISLAAGAESLSEHPIGRAVVERAQELGLATERPREFRSIAGLGIGAMYERDGGREWIYVGSERLFMGEEVDLSAAVCVGGGGGGGSPFRRLQKEGKTVMLVVRRGVGGGGGGACGEEILGACGRDWEVVGFLAVADTVRAGAAGAVAALRQMGIGRIVMLTGDNSDVANAVAAQVGLQEVYAELLPEQKVEIVSTLVDSGCVGMVGDGVNDAPALATADLGIAMGGAGSDVALETADVVLMADDLSKLAFMLRLSRRARDIVRQNIVFSVFVMLILVALTILAPVALPGFRLPLPLGVLGHEGSTLIVVANGLRMLAMTARSEE